jgi:hypothetical protein
MEKGAVQSLLGGTRYVSVNEDLDGEIYLLASSQIFSLFPEPDFDDSGVLDGPDGDIICANFGSDSAVYDLNGDLAVNLDDLDVLMEYANTLLGDIDFNGRVEFADFLHFSQRFAQEGTLWSDGDVNCDNTVDFGDFLVISTNFGMSRSDLELQSVPEPNSKTILVPVVITACCLRRRRRQSWL